MADESPTTIPTALIVIGALLFENKSVATIDLCSDALMLLGGFITGRSM